MSFFPVPSEPLFRIFPYIVASPSPLLDAVQTSVWLYFWLIVPLLYIAAGLFLFFYILCLPFPQWRRRMHRTIYLLPWKIIPTVHLLEKKILKSNVATFVYVLFLGTPLVVMLCTAYGHHPFSFSAYDSPFQALLTFYGFLFPFFLYLSVDRFLMPVSLTLLCAILFFVFTLGFWCVLFAVYFAILRKGIHLLIRWHMLSIGIFTVLQPFMFRFLRYDALPLLFSQNLPDFYGYSSFYLLALFLPCLIYVVYGMLLHARFQKKLPSWFIGLHLGLLYLAVLAADLH